MNQIALKVSYGICRFKISSLTIKRVILAQLVQRIWDGDLSMFPAGNKHRPWHTYGLKDDPFAH